MEPDQESDRQEGVTERSFAAGSLGAFFRKIDWEVVSFFPNSPLREKAQKTYPT